jgi:hypothetical protein
VLRRSRPREGPHPRSYQGIVRIFGFIVPVLSSLVTALYIAAGFAPLPSALLGIGVGCARPLIVAAYGLVMDQAVRGVGPAVFGVAVAAVVYLSLQDFGVALESAHTIAFVALAGLELVRHFVRDEYYSRAWKRIERVLTLVVPYYGKTWAASGEIADRAAVRWMKAARRWAAQKVRRAGVVRLAVVVLLIIGAVIICFPALRRRLLATGAR